MCKKYISTIVVILPNWRNNNNAYTQSLCAIFGARNIRKVNYEY